MASDEARRRDRMVADLLYGAFVKCPTNGRILEVLHGDDKVLCSCGRANSRVPAEETGRTGTHIVRFCDPATVDQWLDQRAADQQFFDQRAADQRAVPYD
jgi:hypothetical protein